MQGRGGPNWKDPMRKLELMSKKPSPGQTAAGFSLLELLISVSFLAVLAVTLVQSLTYCLQVSERTQEHWRDTLSRWNQVQEIRSGLDAGGDLITVMPAVRAMTYQKVPDQTENDDQWGVLSGPR
jgi:Tfp pilus assembly protein PilV